MTLWIEWIRCVQHLRSSCSRKRSFLWMMLVLVGFSIRTELAGVTSFVRALGLQPSTCRRLLHLFHSSALDIDKLTISWIHLVLKLFIPLRLGGRLVFVADGLKVAKEGLKMPAVKKLHQESRNNSKPTFIFGHSFQVIGLLVQGPPGNICSAPLVSRIHEGLIFSDRDKRTLLDKPAHLFLETVKPLEGTALLLADAYYAGRKIIRPLVAKGHHLVTRVRSNAVAYYPAPQPKERKPGRPKVYGEKIRLRDLWHTCEECFISAASPLYGEIGVTLQYYGIDLLRRPVGRLARFVLVIHPARGRIILMSTDCSLLPLDIIAAYGYRFKIEVSFKQAVHTIGTYAYHFWMKMMTIRSRASGNQHLHRKTEQYRQLVRRKIDAYHRYAQLGCIAQGLLRHLSLNMRSTVWRHFNSRMRTMNIAQSPSEAVVAQALKNSLPEFLLKTSPEQTFKKFIMEKIDFERCPEYRLAA